LSLVAFLCKILKGKDGRGFITHHKKCKAFPDILKLMNIFQVSIDRKG
jgi:hypothetical protein